MTNPSKPKIAVIIPCYRVKKHILDVLKKVGSECSQIYVIDDGCPESSGDFVEANNLDPRIQVLRNSINLGVGGAVLRGYEKALKDGMDILVKIDGDNQMEPALIPKFVGPILSGEADYTKGNRFFYLDKINKMPKVRIFGNAILSFLTKLSSGYWGVFDPTNGFTALQGSVAQNLPLQRISKDYFFETDMLFHLNLLRAVVVDIPMDPKYEDEQSNLRISGLVTRFIGKHISNLMKRIFYNYYLRDMSLASVELPAGVVLLSFGLLFGITNWINHHVKGIVTPTGTIMISVTCLLMGAQFILAFLAHDIGSIPTQVVHKRLNSN